MKSCANCKSILITGIKVDGRDYCNRECYETAAVRARAKEIPEDVVRAEVDEIHEGECPVCNGPGPVDLHEAHHVWSVVVLTHSSSTRWISCRSCARKKQLTALCLCSLLGWWGLPWGLLFTPAQIIRNLYAMARNPSRNGPSKDLRRVVARQRAANELYDESRGRRRQSEEPE